MKRRKAIKRATEIVAECPLRCTCSELLDGPKRQWRICGHYEGLLEDRKGLRALCTYKG